MRKYFVYDSYDTGFEEFETLEEAEKHFKEITDFSSYSDGWPQEILDGAIKLGIITHLSCDGEHRHTENKDWDFECDVVQAEVLDNPVSLLEQELQKTREQLEKALIHLKIVLVDNTTSDQFCDAEEFLSSFKDKQGE